MIDLNLVGTFLESAKRNYAEVSLTHGYAEAAKRIAEIALSNRVSSMTLSRLPDKLLEALRSELTGVKMIHNLDNYRLEDAFNFAKSAEMGVVLADAGLAEIGVIIIMNSYSARLATTLPRRLVAVLPASNIIATYDDLADYLSKRYGEAGAAFLIAGPSGTSDIELTFVKGVHGPGDAHFIVVEE